MNDSELPDNAAPSEPPPPRTTGGNWRWKPPAPEELQQMLPTYTIEKLVGSGGMGAVYKGVQTSLERYVAIKILPPNVNMEDPTFTSRFKNEAKVMARLNHPGIVAVHDFGETTNGQLYFVMEYVDGTDVQQMLKASGRLHPQHALAITAHLCDALAYAHANSVVHRDIKPSNVLINSLGQVKVADFGLAKLDDPGSVGLTQTGLAMGTPDFVSPEALITGMSIDGRADLYAVGVMLYTMLCGEVPRGLFMMPSIRFPEIDRRFDAIIARAMQQDREMRYQSAMEIRRDLDLIMFMPVMAAGPEITSAIPRQIVAQTLEQRSAPQRPGQARGAAPATAKSKKPLIIGAAAAALIAGGALLLQPTAETPAPAPATPAVNITVPSANEPPQEQRRPPKREMNPNGPPFPQRGKGDPKRPRPNGKGEPPAEDEDARPRRGPPKDEPAPKPEPTTEPAPAPKPETPATTPPKPEAPAAPVIAELARVHNQFEEAAAERVAKPFASALAALDLNYGSALDRSIGDMKKLGKLDSIIALEEEKKRVAAPVAPSASVLDTPVSVIPEEDDAKTPDALKTLRATYRKQFASYLDQRSKNLKALVDPTIGLLKNIEADLTKQDRVADAKAVMRYRESLSPPEPSNEPAAPPSASGKPPAVKGKGSKITVKHDSRISHEVAELAIKKGASVRLQGLDKFYTSIADLPKGSIKLDSLWFKGAAAGSVTDEDMQIMSRAAEVTDFRLFTASQPDVQIQITSLAPLRNWPLLESFVFNTIKPALISGAELKVLGELKMLNNLGLEQLSLDEQTAAALAKNDALETLRLSLPRMSDITPLRPLSGLKNLRSLTFARGGDLPADLLSIFANCSKLKSLALEPAGKIDATGLAMLSPAISKTLTSFRYGSNSKEQIDAVTQYVGKHFPLLTDLVLFGSISADAFQSLRGMSNLRLLIIDSDAVSRSFLTTIASCKSLEDILIARGEISADDMKLFNELKSLHSLTLGTNAFRNGDMNMTLTDAHLDALASNRKLRRLTLPEAKISASAAAKFRKQRPDCLLELVK